MRRGEFNDQLMRLSGVALVVGLVGMGLSFELPQHGYTDVAERLVPPSLTFLAASPTFLVLGLLHHWLRVAPARNRGQADGSHPPDLGPFPNNI